MCEEIINYLSGFFILVLNMGLGVLIAATFISNYIYLPMVKDGESDEEAEDEDYGDEACIEPSSSPFLLNEEHGTKKEEVEKYDDKYKPEFKELEECSLSDEQLNSLKNNILLEETPKGDILMFYDHEHGYFKFYCTTKELPYATLETVARKYTINNNCKSIYICFDEAVSNAIERKTSLESIKNSLKENEISRADDTGSSIVQNVFASFNSYNKKGGNVGKKSTATECIKNNVNRYKYCGKIEEYKIIQEKQQEDVIKIDFASFKKMVNDENKKLV